MSDKRKMFSICIPSYNRAKYLAPLLDSIYVQDFEDFEIVISEDLSKERTEIAKIAAHYADKYPNTLCYFENSENLGYDGNIRNLVKLATGRFCFFMGNDDLMCEGALRAVADAINLNKNIGFVLKSYALFEGDVENIQQTIKYFNQQEVMTAGFDAISTCFRRSGVISGFVIHRDAAHRAATEEFDGTLFYQMHIVGDVLSTMNAIFLPNILVSCRIGELPEFGNSIKEKGKYVPGVYTPQARLNMVGGALKIAKALEERRGIIVYHAIMRDYANYFFPYIRDQLTLPFQEFFKLYKSYFNLGFYRYPMFHIYCAVCYCLGEKRFDKMVELIRKHLGRSPHLGFSKPKIGSR